MRVRPYITPSLRKKALAYLQKQAALTVDYVTVAVVDAPGGEALTEDGLQVVESLLQ